jgi:hypothetical protein
MTENTKFSETVRNLMKNDADCDNHWQAIMNLAYESWEDGLSMKDWFEALSEIEKQAVSVGKMNYQVENGGFAQWIDNGYAEVMGWKAAESLKLIEQDDVYELVMRVLEIAESNNWGRGTYTEEELVEDEETGEQYYDDVEYWYSEVLCEELECANFDSKFYEQKSFVDDVKKYFEMKVMSEE